MSQYIRKIEQSEQYCNDTLATAFNYLRSKGQNELCIILVLSELQIWEHWDVYTEYDDQEIPDFETPYLDYIQDKNKQMWRCSVILYIESSLLHKIENDVTILLKEAIELSMQPSKDGAIPYIYTFDLMAQRITATETWRQDFLNILKSGESLNQGKFIREEKLVSWNNMRFASMEEMLLAQALEKVKKTRDNLKLVYFPNCLARVLVDGTNVNMYPDFLICINGKWGILEVNGKQHNLPEQAELDNNKRNLLAKAKIQMYFYSAESIRQDAERIVCEFIEQINGERN